MKNLLASLTPSDYVEIFGIAVAFFTSLVAIFISVKTLKQNSKMIEESTRPYLQIYPTYMDSAIYIIVKNFGSSEAYIDEIYCNHQFTSDELYHDSNTPHIFSQIKGAVLPPGYSIRCPLHSHKVSHTHFEFKIIYHSSAKPDSPYTGQFSFTPIANSPFVNTYPSGDTTDAHLHNISKELRNISRSTL